MERVKNVTPQSFIDPNDWLDEEHLTLVSGWARDGYTYKDVAQRIGISNAQLTKWRNAYPEFRDALKKGREIVDYQVENALLKSALGYKIKEVTIITVLKNGKMVETTKQTVTKEVAPNVSACQTWLYNRLPDKWKNMNVKSNILDDLAEEDSNISITVTRASKDNANNTSSVDNAEDKEWESEINKSVTIRKKTEEEKKKERKEKAAKKKEEQQNKGPQKTKVEKIDLDYWPDDWEEDE